MSSGGSVCPRSGGRLRRKKKCVAVGGVIVAVILCLQLAADSDSYSPLMPLSDAKSEARRLLKLITHYHVQCNATLQAGAGNRSHWPLCVERDIGIDLDVKASQRVAYSIGSQGDYVLERELAQNHSFDVYLIVPPPPHAPTLPHALTALNTTHVVSTVLVPNDPADFSRNLYGQRTMNDLLGSLGHRSLDWLKIGGGGGGAGVADLLHFMIEDNLLVNVKQLHIAMYIDKLDDDFLYNWYRVLYNLFYKQGLRLYHTASADSLCLQVTMMESCIYYMSFVQNPGPKVFVLHPPAGYGTAALEEERLLSLLGSMDTECKQEIIGGPNDQTALRFSPSSPASQPQWPVCVSGLYQLFPLPCTVFRFRLGNDHSLEQKFISEGCSVHTVVPVRTRYPTKYRVHSHHPPNAPHVTKPGPVGGGEVVGSESLTTLLQAVPSISLLEIDLPGHEWEVIATLLDIPGLLHNVSQIVAYLQLPGTSGGGQSANGQSTTVSTTLRSHYSQLQRIHMLGFRLFHAQSVPPPPEQPHQQQRGASARFNSRAENCCFKVGYIHKTDWYS